MRIARFGERGDERPAIFDVEGNLRDISALVPDWSGDWLDPDRFKMLGLLDARLLPPVDMGVRFGAPVAGIGKIIGIGLNYADHAKEAGLDLPDEPVWFLKATSALSGPNDPILIPRGGDKVDWEAELAVIVGRTLSHADEDEALAAVAGYTVMNDVSERAFQLEQGGQWTRGKSCDTFAPLGPWLTVASAVHDPHDLDIWLSVNGERQQMSNTHQMVFGVGALLATLSRYMTLHPGDVVATGTPGGVGFGQSPKRFLREGDVVELGIAGLGEQRQTVIDYHDARTRCG